MEKITRGGSKNGPVYQASQLEIDEMNDRLMNMKIQEITQEYRYRTCANDNKFLDDQLIRTGKKLPNRYWVRDIDGGWFSVNRKMKKKYEIKNLINYKRGK